ncbi:MAG TPA: hypothetical protein P5300_06930, partial [Acidobacteriota bacterium]|nr:hypothetical protein [Acidobacteriota bacterium]
AVVESFRDEAVRVKLVLGADKGTLRDLISGEEIAWTERRRPVFGAEPAFERVFELELPPHSFRALEKP